MPRDSRRSPDQLFRAFADRTRLRILHLLQEGELCVCDLVSILRVPQPTASRHLGYLRRAGLVRVRKNGSWNYYALAEPGTVLHSKLLECIGPGAAGMPELARDARRRASTPVGARCG